MNKTNSSLLQFLSHSRFLIRKAFFALGLLYCPASGWAQNYDPFLPEPNGPVYAAVPQPDGKILIAGNFSSLNGGGISRTNLCRVNSGGTVESTFKALISGGIVYCVLVLPDGRIMIGGDFTAVGGKSRLRIARLNSDGTLDQTFDCGTNFNATINCLSLQQDGNTLVGGSFTNAGLRYIARVQTNGSVDTNFAGISSGPINCLMAEADGKILVGGAFTNLCGQIQTNIGRLEFGGTLDTNFNAKVYGNASAAVRTLALQPDGKILIGGTFTNLNGQGRTNLTRVNSDGSSDTAFSSQSVGSVLSLCVQTDGKIVVGGSFTSLAGQSRNYLGRINADGSLDTSFLPSVNGTVNGVALQNDGKVLLGGNFTSVGGNTVNYVARLIDSSTPSEALSWNQSTVSWARSGSSGDFSQTRFEMSVDGATWTPLGQGVPISGGWQITGLALPAVCTIHASGFVNGGYQNGSSSIVNAYTGQPCFVSQPLSTTVPPLVTTNLNVQVAGTPGISLWWYKNGVRLTNSSKIVGVTNATLAFNNVSGAETGPYSFVASNSFGSVTSSIANFLVMDPLITNQPLTQLLNVGQTMTLTVAAIGTALKYQWRQEGATLSGATKSSLSITNVQQVHAGIYDVVVNGTYGSVTSNPARLMVNSALIDNTFNKILGGDLYAIALQPNGQILLAGIFGSGVTRTASDGTYDASFNPALDSLAYSISVQEDGKILPCGKFNYINSQFRPYIGRLMTNGSLESNFNPLLTNGPVFPAVYSIFQQASGKTLIAGSFSSATGSSISLLRADGFVDTNFLASANDIVYSSAQQPDGKILIGGVFTNVNAVRRNYIARLNSSGTLDPDFDPNANGLVTSIAVQPDGKILVAGPFTGIGGLVRNRIGRLNSDGTVDQSFNPNAGGTVRTIALQADGRMIVGGDFTSLDGLSRNYLGRLNADGTVDANFNPGASSNVYALTLQGDGKVLVGGSFISLAGQTHAYIGRLLNTDPATETLTFDASSIHWMRGGSAAEVWRTSFDYSINGDDWIKLGEGERIAGGWQLQDLNLPANASVRARGYVLGGRYQSSGGIVESKAGQLAFSNGPLSRTNNAGTSAQFTVTPQGAPPLYYRWYKGGIGLTNGVNISGAASVSLVVSNVVGTNAGDYSVMMTNSSGAITSGIATLTVIDPYIWQQPTNQMANGGGTGGLAVTAAGANLSYLWRKEGTNLTGKTTSLLAVTNAQWADRGNYDVVVSSSFGSITSAPAVFDVVLPYPANFLSNGGELGFRSNQFGFNFLGNAGQVTILDGSANLIDWTPLYTNTNGFEATFFSDLESTNSPVRFYRLRAP